MVSPFPLSDLLQIVVERERRKKAFFEVNKVFSRVQGSKGATFLFLSVLERTGTILCKASAMCSPSHRQSNKSERSLATFVVGSM